MAGRNHSQDESDDDTGSETTDEAEDQLRSYVWNQRCTCVKGQEQKCERCRIQQRLNSKAYRQRVATYKEERDAERTKNVELQGRLDVYRPIFIRALEQQSIRCQRCGAELPPAMLPSDAPSQDDFRDDTRSVIAESEGFLRQLKPTKGSSAKPRARKKCDVCGDARTCAECKKKEGQNEASARCRERKQQQLVRASELLRRLIDDFCKLRAKSAELTWQNMYMKEAACRRCPSCGGTNSEVPLDWKQKTDAPPHKRAAFDYASGWSPTAGPSGLQRGGQEAVSVLREASQKDDGDDNASIDGHHEIIGQNPPGGVAQGGSIDWEPNEVISACPFEEQARHVHSFGTSQSVGMIHAAPPIPPHGSYSVANALRSAEAASTMMIDAQSSEQTDDDENLEVLSPGLMEFIDQQLADGRVDPAAFLDPSSPASITGGPDQQPLLGTEQVPSMEYHSGGGASRSSGPSQSAAPTRSPILPHGGVRPSGPSDDASDTGYSQPDGSTTRKPGFMHSAYEAVRNIGMKVRSNTKEKNVFARTQIAAPTIPPTSYDVHFKSPSLASKHSQPPSSSPTGDGGTVGVQSINIYHFIPPDAPTVESEDEADLLADYELVDELAVLTLAEDDYRQHVTAERQENSSSSTAANEADQMPEASVDASGVSNADVLEKPQETELSTSSIDESSDDETDVSVDEENPYATKPRDRED